MMCAATQKQRMKLEINDGFLNPSFRWEERKRNRRLGRKFEYSLIKEFKLEKKRRENSRLGRKFDYSLFLPTNCSLFLSFLFFAQLGKKGERLVL